MTTTKSLPDSDLSRSDLRGVMRNFASSVAVITCRYKGSLFGFTCNSFTSVSLTPELISFCLNKASTSNNSILSAGKFVVNILAHNQQDIALQFAKPSSPSPQGDNAKGKFSGVKYELREFGPVLPGVNSYLECNLQASNQVGDHNIIIGKVSSSYHKPAGKSLLYWNRQFAEY